MYVIVAVVGAVICFCVVFFCLAGAAYRKGQLSRNALLPTV